MTRSGVEYDLVITPYVVEIDEGKKCSYHFSTERAMEKFKAERVTNRIEIENSLSNRFKMKFKISQLFADVQLYKRLERRGFYININGKVVRFLSQIESNEPDLQVYDRGA